MKNYFSFLVFLIIYELSVYINNDMILPATPALYEALGAPQSDIPFSLTYFLLGGVFTNLLVGSFSDRYGRRPVMLLGCVVVLLGNLLAIIAGDISWYYVGRVLQGMGLAFITAAGYPCVHELYDTKAAIRNVSLMASVTLFAPMVGPVTGGILFTATGLWQSIFIVTFLVTLVSFFGLYWTMPETLKPENRAALYFPTIIKGYWLILKDTNFLWPSLSISFLVASLIVWIGSSPLVLMNDFGFSPFAFGLLQVPIFLTFILGTILLRALSERTEPQFFVRLGMILSAVSCPVIFLPIFFDSYYLSTVFFIIGMSILNFGFGCLFAPMNRLILESVSYSKAASSALCAFLNFLIMAGAPAILTLLLGDSKRDFTLSILILVIGGLFFYFISHLRPRSRVLSHSPTRKA